MTKQDKLKFLKTYVSDEEWIQLLTIGREIKSLDSEISFSAAHKKLGSITRLIQVLRNRPEVHAILDEILTNMKADADGKVAEGIFGGGTYLID